MCFTSAMFLLLFLPQQSSLVPQLCVSLSAGSLYIPIVALNVSTRLHLLLNSSRCSRLAPPAGSSLVFAQLDVSVLCSALHSSYFSPGKLLYLLLILRLLCNPEVVYLKKTLKDGGRPNVDMC